MRLSPPSAPTIPSARASLHPNAVAASTLPVSHKLAIPWTSLLSKKVLFEESILAIVPAACFLFIAPIRARGLIRSRFLVRRNVLHRAKLLTVAAYAALQLVLLVLAARAGPSGAQTRASVASAALCLVSGLLLLPLSHLEHAKSARPSYLINLYLLLTALFDVARVRTLWLLGTDKAIAGALSASLAVKCVLLVLEAVEKRSLLVDVARLSLESTSGLFSRGTFWWLNTLLMSGSKRILTSEGLPAIHEKLNSKRLAEEFQAAWENCKSCSGSYDRVSTDIV